MLVKAAREITHISEDDNINSQNYMEVTNYIDDLYRFINKLKLVVPTKNVTFLPTFKGCRTCEIFNIQATEKENELKIFRIKSQLFLEDKEELREKISGILGPVCETIVYDGDIILFILK